MTMITLHNYFHRTSIRIRAGKISPERARRIRRALCGCDGCTCSDDLGTRAGNQPGERAVDGGSIVLIGSGDGYGEYAAQAD